MLHKGITSFEVGLIKISPIYSKRTFFFLDPFYSLWSLSHLVVRVLDFRVEGLGFNP